MSATFKKTEKVRKRGDFDAVYAGGRRFYSRSFVVVVLGDRAEIRRIGVVASRKLGKAYRRNRIKRLLREFYRLNKSLFPENADTVVIANRPTSIRNLQDVSSELSAVLKKCSVSRPK